MGKLTLVAVWRESRKGARGEAEKAIQSPSLNPGERC